MANRKQVNYKVFNASTIGAGDIAIPDKKVVRPDSFKVEANDRLLLQRACNYWNGLGDFRKRRERNRRYYRGDQWGDKVYDPDTETYVTEE